MAIRARQASEAILEGYREGLRSGGRAFVLAEHHKGLRDMALNELRDPVVFWKKMEALPEWKGPVPEEARRGLEELLPQPGLKYRRKRRVAGLGSLGRQRIVALADWGGGCVVREAKALVPSGVFGPAHRSFRKKSGARSSSPALCASGTPSCMCAAIGSCAGSLQTVPGSSFPRSPNLGMRPSCSIRWGGKPPMCISGAAKPCAPSKGIWQGARDVGYTKRRRKWPRPSPGTGRNGKTRNPTGSISPAPSRGGNNGHALFDQLPWNAAGESLRLGSLNE